MNPKRITKTDSYSKIEEEIRITYTQAVIEYKNWKFIISPEDKPSCSLDMTFEIKVLHDDFYGDDIYLTNSGMGYISPQSITSFSDAFDKVKKFISNELK